MVFFRPIYLCSDSMLNKCNFTKRLLWYTCMSIHNVPCGEDHCYLSFQCQNYRSSLLIAYYTSNVEANKGAWWEDASTCENRVVFPICAVSYTVSMDMHPWKLLWWLEMSLRFPSRSLNFPLGNAWRKIRHLLVFSFQIPTQPIE